MPAPAYPDYRTPGERERDRKRAVAEQKKADAEAAAERRAELDRIERLRAVGTQTPQSHPHLFRRIELNVHVEYLTGDIDVMMRTIGRISEARRVARNAGDVTAFRQADEEGTMLAEILKLYMLLQIEEERNGSGSGQLKATRQVLMNAAGKQALRRLREAS